MKKRIAFDVDAAPNKRVKSLVSPSSSSSTAVAVGAPLPAPSRAQAVVDALNCAPFPFELVAMIVAYDKRTRIGVLNRRDELTIWDLDTRAPVGGITTGVLAAPKNTVVHECLKDGRMIAVPPPAGAGGDAEPVLFASSDLNPLEVWSYDRNTCAYKLTSSLAATDRFQTRWRVRAMCHLPGTTRVLVSMFGTTNRIECDELYEFDYAKGADTCADPVCVRSPRSRPGTGPDTRTGTGADTSASATASTTESTPAHSTPSVSIERCITNMFPFPPPHAHIVLYVAFRSDTFWPHSLFGAFDTHARRDLVCPPFKPKPLPRNNPLDPTDFESWRGGANWEPRLIIRGKVLAGAWMYHPPSPSHGGDGRLGFVYSSTTQKCDGYLTVPLSVTAVPPPLASASAAAGASSSASTAAVVGSGAGGVNVDNWWSTVAVEEYARQILTRSDTRAFVSHRTRIANRPDEFALSTYGYLIYHEPGYAPAGVLVRPPLAHHLMCFAKWNTIPTPTSAAAIMTTAAATVPAVAAAAADPPEAIRLDSSDNWDFTTPTFLDVCTRDSYAEELTLLSLPNDERLIIYCRTYGIGIVDPTCVGDAVFQSLIPLLPDSSGVAVNPCTESIQFIFPFEYE